MLAVFVLGNINSVINKAHTLVCSFVLKCVAVPFTKLNYKVDDFRSSIWDLDRVRLNMRNSKAPFLNFLFKVDHKQSSSFSYDIVNIPLVLKRIIEGGRSESIDTVDYKL